MNESKWLEENYPGYQDAGQALAFNDNKPYDLISIITADGVEIVIYFDLTTCFGF